MYYAVRPEPDVVKPPGIMVTPIYSSRMKADVVAQCGHASDVVVVGTDNALRPLQVGRTIRSAWAAMTLAVRSNRQDIADALSTAISMGQPAELDEEQAAALAALGVPAPWWGGQ